MKSMTKMMVIALAILVALLAVASPAMARTDNKTIVSGDTIYVYENDLNLASLGAVVRLAHYSDKTAGVTDNIIEVPDNTNFDVSAADVNGYYDAYYAWDATGIIGGAAGPNPYVLIKNPTLALDVVLNSSHVDSVNGKSITRTSPISFKITTNVAAGFTNIVGNASVANNATPTFQVEVTTPDGGKLTTFGTPAVVLNQFGPTSSTIYTDVVVGNISLTSITPGTYTALAKWNSGIVPDFYKRAADSNSVSFTIVSKAVSIQSNKESVVRGNNFVVTIQGESLKPYWVFVENPETVDASNPTLVAGQSGVVANTATNATVTTTAAGTRPVEFATTADTEDKAFTIRVQDPLDSSKYDTVRVSIEKGAVTATVSGTGTFYLGEEIKLTGTNTDNKVTTYVFMTGPNLNANGVSLTDSTVQGYTEVDVEADNTWEYNWDTSQINGRPDAGTYTIWAASGPVTKSNVSDAEYDTASIIFRKPFVTATVSSSTVAKGDEITISGVAEGKPNSVYLWIFGKNMREADISVSVEDDGTYEHTFNRGETSDWASGQYYAVVQHPMENGIQDVDLCGTPLGANNDPAYTICYGTTSTEEVDLSDLQASDAATALVDWINKPQSDDTYTKLTFLLEEPWITIDTVGDKYVGDTFTITGTTNLAEGDTLLIEVVSAAFQPTDKATTGEFSGATGQATVVKGATANTWSFEVDAATFQPDQYIVNIEDVEGTGTTATTTFNVLERTATTATPTTNVTATPTTNVTTVVTTTATTVPPTTQPGFGALVALVGLGAVAVLVLRRH